jgi:uncharacterized protein YraI
MDVKLRWFLLLGALFFVLTVSNNQIVEAQSECYIENFTISPDEDSYALGSSLELYGSSNCGTVRFEIDRVPRVETSAREQRATLQTVDLDAGVHRVCFAGYGLSGWKYDCQRVIVRGQIDVLNTGYSTCPIDFSRVGIGEVVTVSDYDTSPLQLRQSPGLDRQITAYIPVRTALTILNGPICNSGWRWWQVEYNGLVGWVGEVGPERLYNITPPQCHHHRVSLEVGDWVQVTPGTPNRVRSDAGLDYPEFALAYSGTPLRITDGPACHDNIWWWEIRYGIRSGWTAEGDALTNWLELAP